MDIIEFIPEILVRRRALLKRVDEIRTIDKVTKPEPAMLLGMIDGLAAQERAFAAFLREWPHLVWVREEIAHLDEVEDWLNERDGVRDRFHECFGFSDADLAFEFRQRWC